MRLALLIVVAVAIVGGAAGSYYHYRCWHKGRYDDMIIEAATAHGIDPALVKALIKVQTNFRFGATTEDGSRGLLLVSPRVAEAYREAHGREAWGYICMHRHFRNHDPNKPEQFTSSEPGSCQAPGCKQLLIDELRDPETNLEVGCWFLSYAAWMLRDKVKPGELEAAILVAYRWGLPKPGSVELSPEQRTFIHSVLRERLRLIPYFDKRARRAVGR
jgi:hypothetical protein